MQRLRLALSCALLAAVAGAGAQTAVAIERVAFGVLGDVAAAVSAADEAALTKGFNGTLDAEVAAAVKALVSGFKSELQAVGLLKPAASTKAARSLALDIEGRLRLTM